MKHPTALSIALSTGSLLALGAAQAQAQGLNTTIGPIDAPLGTPISITACNDTAGYADAYGCGWAVYDDKWDLVYDPDVLTNCTLMSLFMGPWGWHNLTWDQTDLHGKQVPPGSYRILNLPASGGSTVTEIRIGVAETSLWLEGTAILHSTLDGQHRNFALSSPQDPGRVFVQWIGDTGQLRARTCAGPLPIAAEGIAFPGVEFGSSAGVPMICGATGVLDGQGYSTQPKLCPPDDPALVGHTFSTAFLVLDPADACGIARISEAVEFEFGG